MAQKDSSFTYDAASIKTLEGLDAVRTRPAMYIGGTGSGGLQHLVWEIVDNAVDEAAAGFASRIEIVLHNDGSVFVSDNGRGIPVGKHPELGVSAVEVVFTELHAGGKFGEGAYGASGGLHGVGASVVNAMSTRVDVEVMRSGKSHRLGFKERVAGQFAGGRFTPGHKLAVKPRKTAETGTKVRFWPDMDIFSPTAKIDAAEVATRMQQAVYLIPGTKVKITDRREGASGETLVLESKAGLVDLVEDRSADTEAVTSTIHIEGAEPFVEKVPVNGKVEEVERECRVEIAMKWVHGDEPDVHSFVNTIPTRLGGTHMAGFEGSLTRAVNNLLLKDMRKLARLARDGKAGAKGENAQEGLVAAVRVVVNEPQFRGQTKQELGTPAVQGIVSRIAYEGLRNWMEPGGGPRSQVKALANKVADSVINRVAAQQQLETRRKAAKTTSAVLPDKLADSRTHGQAAELILVEGDSAAGPAKRGRNSETMAILPLRGKIVNAAKSSPKQVLANVEAQAIFTAMGAGVGAEFDLESARYGRIVILCDADVDGSHIRCLLLTLIYRHMKPLLTEGRVYSAQPPLYTAKVGDKTHRAYSDEERDEKTKKLTRGKRGATKEIKWQRFKGLGEMNVDELRYCALDPRTRTLRQLTIGDAAAAAAAAEMFDTLMGSNVDRRRDYIVSQSQLVDAESLDF